MPSPGCDEEVGADVDEPPDLHRPNHPPPNFQRSQVRPAGCQKSLLTMAIDMEAGARDDIINRESPRPADMYYPMSPRRRSMASNFSIASTAELTSDTGLTSPSRPSTPSPPQPEFSILRIASGHFNDKAQHPPELRADSPETKPPGLQPTRVVQTSKPEPLKKRCISFACGNPPSQPPKTQAQAQVPAPAPAPVPAPSPAPTSALAPAPTRPQPMVKAPSAQEAPRKLRIKFACPARPSSTQNTPPHRHHPSPRTTQIPLVQVESPSTPKKSPFHQRTGSGSHSPKHLSPRRHSKSPAPARRPKYLRATSTDLISDASHFHEFASPETREDDWIRQAKASSTEKITIDDTLVKENRIRRLAREAEEEAEIEEEEADAANNNDDDDDDDENEDGEDDEDVETVQDEEEQQQQQQQQQDDEEEGDDEDDGHASDDSDGSDGYHSDEETGFADSDDSDGEDAEPLWIPGERVAPFNRVSPAWRRPSIAENFSDASTAAEGDSEVALRPRITARRSRPRPETPELPDSTDFVCGTLDEDRPLEEAYISCLKERKRNKLHLIPQDIDPSFPASEPEDEEDEDDDDVDGDNATRKGHDSDEHVWMHGEMEDLHHEEGGRSRRKRRGHASPPPRRILHSPPPARRAPSPAPKPNNGRSPRHGCGTAGRRSPRRLRSPAPPRPLSPIPSPNHHVMPGFGLKLTRSLPRPAGLLGLIRNGRRKTNTGLGGQAQNSGSDVHVRGAIDIVMGLEEKRRRRAEKCRAEYCDRARKGQLPERKVTPGAGAKKMEEIGLLMAGKKERVSFVLSV